MGGTTAMSGWRGGATPARSDGGVGYPSQVWMVAGGGVPQPGLDGLVPLPGLDGGGTLVH